MSGLSVHGRRLVLELNRAIDNGDSRRCVALVDSWGLHRTERLAVCRELDRPRVDDAELVFGPFDLARVWKRDRAEA